MINLVFLFFGSICVMGIVSNAIQDESIKKLLIFVTAVALILLAGFREIGVDQDSVGYLLYYNLDNSRMSLAAEPTFVFIANTMHGAFQAEGIRWLFIIYATLGVTIKLLAIKRLTNLFWLSVLTYFSGYYLLHEVTQIRAGVASGLVLLSVYFIYRRKLLPFMATIAVASLFHYSALVALPLYFLRSDLSKKIKIAIALAIPVGILVRTMGINLLYVIPIQLVESKIDIYTQSTAYNSVALNVFNAVYLIKYILLYLFLLFERNIAPHSKYFGILLQMYAFAMFSYLALSYNAAFAIRISELFGIVEIVLIPMLLYATRSRALGVVAVVLLAMGNLALGIYQTELIHQDGWRGG